MTLFPKRRPVSAQCAVEPLFYQAPTGAHAMYDLPTVWRNRSINASFDNVCRLAAYYDRLQAHLSKEQAA